MPTRFAEISFTDSVKLAQTRYGSRESNRGFELSDEPRNRLTAAEQSFIEARDSFYQATVGQNGWPYVQFRGGPPGFIKVLDDQTIGFADFRGNRQYISVGNLGAEERIALIFMDYPSCRRLKLWARAKIIDAIDDPTLVARLEVSGYRAQVERGIILTIEAFDWNCPRHITPRYRKEEVQALFLNPLEAQIAALTQEIEALKAGKDSSQ